MALGTMVEKQQLFNLIKRILQEPREGCLGAELDHNIVEQLSRYPENGKSLEKLSDDIVKKILPYCSSFHDPAFMGFPDSGDSFAALMGSISSELLQQNLINASFCSPMATQIEISVIKWFRQLVGYEVSDVNTVEKVGGIVTTGGTLSNTIALMLARINKCPSSYVQGIKEPEQFKVVVPKGIAHYSIASALHWIGCGNQVIEVPTNAYRYDQKELKKHLKIIKIKLCV